VLVRSDWWRVGVGDTTGVEENETYGTHETYVIWAEVGRSYPATGLLEDHLSPLTLGSRSIEHEIEVGDAARVGVANV
jgi:hypothetical protein